jgi:hypothetical protein
MRYIWLTVACILGGITLNKPTYAQTAPSTAPPPYVPKVVPPSPEAAALMKFVDVPISPYTGTADVSIPIYTIQAKGISVPITLAYHTGGIRLDEEASPVGLGWALNSGGMISRTINDKDDLGGMYFGQPIPQLQGDLTDNQPANGAASLSVGYKYFFNFNCSYLVNFTSGTGDYVNAFSPTAETPYDLEPDSYSYNFLGQSGKFIITRDKRVILEQQDNIKIQLVQNGPTDATLTFMITDDNGNKFYFNQTQSCIPAWQSGGTPSSWFLTKIVTQQNDVVTFNYTGDPVKPFTYVVATNSQSYRPFLSADAWTYGSSTGTSYNNVMLQSIDYAGGQVTFSFDDNRNDLQGGQKLNSINIFSKTATGTKFLKAHNFYYSYFKQTEASLEMMRLRLDSIKEVSGANAIKPHVFVYNDPPPFGSGQKHSFSIDHWGYYNGAGNTVLIPSTSTYYYNQVQTASQFSFSGANREPSFDQTKCFSLKKITYPTGGSSELNYEANTYDYNKSIQRQQENQQQVTVLVDTSIYLNTSRSGTIDFSKIYPLIPPTAQGYNATVDIAFISTSSSGWPYQDRASSNKLYVNFNGNITDISNNNLNCSPDPRACSLSYQLALNHPTALPWTFYYDQSAIPPADLSLVRLKVMFNALKTVVQANPTLTAGGLRINSITDYSSSGVIAKKRVWNYHYGASGEYSNGLLMSFPSYIHQEMVEYSDGNLYPQLVLYSSSNTPLTSSIGGNIVGYSQVTESTIDPSNGADNGKVVYRFINAPDSVISYNGFRMPGIPNVGNHLNGSLLSKITYRNNGGNYFKVNETDNYYHTTNRNVYYSAKYLSSAHIYAKAGQCGVSFVPNAGMAEFFASIKSERILQDSTREIVYDQDTTKFMVNSTKSFYDNPVHYQLTRTIATDSKGIRHVSKITYPQDYIVSTGLTNNTILDTLIRRNMLTESIEKRDSIFYPGSATGLVTSASITKYRQLSTGTVVPDKLYKLDITKPVTDFQAMSVSGNTISQDSRYRQLINFDGYDHVGNVSQYTATNQLPVSIIWDYKRVSPIAQINNADSLSVAYTSFEAEGTGHWTVASTARDNTAALTGVNSYNLANGALSKTGLTAANTYILSYWTKNASPLTISGTIAGFPLKGATNKGWTNYIHRVTGQAAITVSGIGSIDEVRLYPFGAQMTSYTYDPLVGVTSITDAKNQVSYYEYDPFQRLMNIKDKDGNILKHVDYHYTGQ